MRRFRSFNHSTCKTVVNLLEAVYLGRRKIEVERVTLVKFRVDNRRSNGTGCLQQVLYRCKISYQMSVTIVQCTQFFEYASSFRASIYQPSSC